MVGKVLVFWQFGEGENYVFCVLVGGVEGYVIVWFGLIVGVGGLILCVDFDIVMLFYLQMWCNESCFVYVVGIEFVLYDWKLWVELVVVDVLLLLQFGEFCDYGFCFVFV